VASNEPTRRWPVLPRPLIDLRPPRRRPRARVLLRRSNRRPARPGHPPGKADR